MTRSDPENPGPTTRSRAGSPAASPGGAPDGAPGGAPPLGDGPATHVEVEVRATAAALWPLVTDVTLPARWSQELVEVRWEQRSAPVAVGDRFVGNNAHEAIGRWEVPCWVSVCEPDRSFGWVTSDPQRPGAAWRLDLVPAGDVTRLGFWGQLGPGRSGLTAAFERWPDKRERIVERRLGEWRSNMQRVVEGLRELAEQAGA